MITEWAQVALTTSVSFMVLCNEMDIFWQNCRLREEIVTIYSTVARTPRQRIVEIMLLKEDMEKHLKIADVKLTKVSAQKVAAEYQSKGGLSPSNPEQLKDSYIEAAITVYTRALNNVSIMQQVEACETLYGHHSPFNSIYKLTDLVVRGGNTPTIAWIINGVSDMCQSNMLLPSDCSREFLCGKTRTTIMAMQRFWRSKSSCWSGS